MYRTAHPLFVAIVLAAAISGPRPFATSAELPTAVASVEVAGGYAVVVSEKTRADADWKPVVRALQDKYPGAQVITYKQSVGEAKAALAKSLPRYTCFVARPSELGRTFVVNVHRLTRRLNDDPYTDTLWGILTGYDSASALQIASCREPLTLHKGVGIGMNLGPFDEGFDLSDARQGLTRTKSSDGKTASKEAGDADRAADFVRALNEMKPDCLGSDGHATERDLQMPWSRGQLRSRKGQLVGIDRNRNLYPVDSPNPKVYLAYGNCLIGTVDGPDAIALAFMKSAGVRQMVGYNVVTWYGKGGWGQADWLFGQPGRFSFAETFFINQQMLLYTLRSRFPKHANFDIDEADYDREGTHLGRIAAKLGYRGGDPGDAKEARDELGMLWDRDTVAFYGDPAWTARFAKRPLDWDQEVIRTADGFRFTVTALKTADIGPVFAFLPGRISHVQVAEGGKLKPEVGSFFVMIPKVGHLEKGQGVTVSLTGKVQ
jgi:hypothetical protein